MFPIIISAIIITFASLSGVLFIWNKNIKKALRETHYLVTFSAGVFSMVSVGLIIEAFSRSTTPYSIIFMIISGILFLEIMGRVITNTHHHHSTDYHHHHSRVDARRLMLGASIHDSIHGVFLVPAYAIDFRLGIATTIALFIHEAVQGVSKFFVLKEAGYSTVRALLLNFSISLTIFIGVTIGILVDSATQFVPYFLAFVGGAFIFVVFRDLLPSTFRDIARTKTYRMHLIAGAFGISVVLGMGMIVFQMVGL